MNQKLFNELTSKRKLKREEYDDTGNLLLINMANQCESLKVASSRLIKLFSKEELELAERMIRIESPTKKPTHFLYKKDVESIGGFLTSTIHPCLLCL